MTKQNRHWTPRSGFFPCAAKSGNCPKQGQHFTTEGKTKEELKASYKTSEEEARKAMLNGEIDAQQYKTVTTQLRNDVLGSIKELRAENSNFDKKQKIYSTNIRRGLAALTGGAILVGSLTGCGVAVAKLPDASQDIGDTKSVIQTLDDAEKINVNKALISFGDNWGVSADGEKVGEVKGQVIPVLGDTYSLYSNKGNLVGSEAEQIVKLLPGATLYDHNNEERGQINQDVSLIMQNFTITDKDGNKVGEANQKLGFTLDFDIKDSKGEVEYSVKKALISWGASLDIERKVANPDVSAQDAVWLAVVVNELNESSGSSSSKK